MPDTTRYGLLDSSISTCTFATDGTGDITVGASHGLSAGQLVRFSTTGALPTEINISGQYFVLSAGLTTTKLRIALTAGGTVITFATAGTGTHTIWKTTKSSVIYTRGVQPFLVHSYQMPSNQIGVGASTGFLEVRIGVATFFNTTISTSANHGLTAGQRVRFADVPLWFPITNDGVYFVLSSGLGLRQLQIATIANGTPIDFGATSDFQLFGVPSAFGANDVVLYAATTSIYKDSATKGVLSTSTDFAWTAKWLAFGVVQTLSLTATESLVIASAVTTAIQPIRVSATESLSLSESIIVHAPIRLTVTETLTTADVPTRIGQFFRLHEIQSASNQLSIHNAPVVTLPKMRTVAEMLTVIVEPAQTIGPGSNVTESLAMSDNAQRLLALVRTQTDALSLSEFVTGSRTNLRLVSEALALSDSVFRLVAYGRGAVEALSIAVSVIGPGMIGVDATDSLSLAESISRVWGAGRLASESLSIADLAAFLASYHFSATETLLIADSADAARLRPATATETLLIASVATFGGNYGRQSGETLVLSLAANRWLALRRVVTQLLQILESPTAASGFALTASEALLIEEWAHWITGPHDPWEYWLDLRTGNLPLESTLDVPEAESIASVPEAESALDAPEAESELVGSVADSSGFRYIDP